MDSRWILYLPISTLDNAPSLGAAAHAHVPCPPTSAPHDNPRAALILLNTHTRYRLNERPANELKCKMRVVGCGVGDGAPLLTHSKNPCAGVRGRGTGGPDASLRAIWPPVAPPLCLGGTPSDRKPLLTPHRTHVTIHYPGPPACGRGDPRIQTVGWRAALRWWWWWWWCGGRPWVRAQRWSWG